MASTGISVKKVATKSTAKRSEKRATPVSAAKKTSSTAAKKKTATPASEKAVVSSNTKVDAVAKKINDLHSAAVGETINGVARIVNAWATVGEALLAKKKKTPHGQWLPWVNKNLVFTPRQAQKYMQAFEERDSLLDAGSLNLDTALAKISPAKEKALEAHVGSDEADEEIKALNAQLKELKGVIADLENDDSVSELEKMYESTLAELEELKKQGSESSVDVEEGITRLKKSRAQLRAEVAGLRNFAGLMSRSRKFFAQEIGLIPSLEVSRVIVKNTKKDVVALLNTVEDWVTAMREKFDV